MFPESTVRKQCVDEIYHKTIAFITAALKDKFVCMQIDETTDSSDRSVANVVMGTLEEHPSRAYLVKVKIMETVNGTTIGRLFEDTLIEFSVPRDRILAFITDGAAYIIAAERGTKGPFPKTYSHYVRCA